MSAAPRGFTLIEMALVAGLTAAFAASGMLACADAYDAAAFRSDRDTVVAALRMARARALNGVGGAAHGVHAAYADGSEAGCSGGAWCLEVFDGPVFAARAAGNVEIGMSPGTMLAWSDDDPVFLSPDGSSGDTRIVLTRGRRVVRITVNAEGGMSYE